MKMCNACIRIKYIQALLSFSMWVGYAQLRESMSIQGRGRTPPLGIQKSRMANFNQKQTCMINLHV
jgi:hypothetical protein